MTPIAMMGTVSSYTETMKLETQWSLKKQSGDLSAHRKSLDEWLGAASASAQSDDRGGDGQLRSIHTKLDAGQKLTAQERAYLKEKDAQAYSELEAAEQEQRAYEQKLKRCRTKEEVRRLKMAHLGSSLARVNAVKNDPAIPLEKKLKIATREKRLCDRLEESTRQFVRRGEYDALPTDREYIKAEQETAERPTPKPEEPPAPAQSAAASTPAGRAEDPAPKIEARQQTDQTEKPRSEPESPEARKVRRAKARAAYVRTAEPPEPTQSALDVKT